MAPHTVVPLKLTKVNDDEMLVDMEMEHSYLDRILEEMEVGAAVANLDEMTYLGITTLNLWLVALFR